MNQKVKQFFIDNPEATEAHLALGKVFGNEDDAKKYLAGVEGVSVQSFSKDDVNTSGAGGTTDQQPDGNLGTEDVTKGQSSNTTTEIDQNTSSGNVTEPGQAALNSSLGKSKEEIEAAIKSQEGLIEKKKQEVKDAKGFGKKKPQTELETLEKELLGMRLALGETTIPEE